MEAMYREGPCMSGCLQVTRNRHTVPQAYVAQSGILLDTTSLVYDAPGTTKTTPATRK